MMTNENYIVDLAKILDKKQRFDFAEEMFSDEKAFSNSSTMDESVDRQLKVPAPLVSASGVSSSMRFIPSNPNELYDRIKLLLQEKQTGKSSNIITESIITIADKVLEYKCISTKQYRFFLISVYTD